MNAKTSIKPQWFGYFPGVIGKVTELHAVYYFKNWNFDVSFEAQVGRELSSFFTDFQEKRDGFWALHFAGAFAGAIAIDGRTEAAEGARLRWFIVEPQMQNLGLGQMLIEKAVSFCRAAGHPKIFLWTFRGLDAARRLYERQRFRLVEEHPVEQWGTKINEQKFELKL